MREQPLGRGQSIQGFDSLEEMLAYQRAQEQQAIDDALPEQWEIDWGDDVLRVVDELWIFGHVFTQEEFLRENQLGKNPDQELLAELEDIKLAHTRGYRYGKWYSEVEPTGEYGSAHIVSLWKISKLEFEAARRNAWQPWPALAFQVGQQVGDARKRRDESDGSQE